MAERDLEKMIKSAIKEKKAILGFRECIKFLKMNIPKVVIIANNIPESLRKEIEYNAKISRVEVKVFNRSSKELGVICGKPFPVSTIVIKE